MQLGTSCKPNTIWKATSGKPSLKVRLRRSSLPTHYCLQQNLQTKLAFSLCGTIISIWLTELTYHNISKNSFLAFFKTENFRLCCFGPNLNFQGLSLHDKYVRLTFILQKLASIFSCSTSFLAWPTLMVLFTGVSPFILATNTATYRRDGKSIQ